MSTAATPPPSRLDQLEGYLREDPTNPHLLADACEAAMAAGEHARAEAHMARAQALQLDAAAWGFRRAQLAIARHDWLQALEQLAAVQALAGEQVAIAHDTAFVQFRQGAYDACRDTLAPWLERIAQGGEDADTGTAVQALWLRACHHAGSLDEGWAWVVRQAVAGTLPPQVAGVASLVAVDRADFPSARRLADAALGAGAAPPEALVARAYVALAERETALAEGLLRQALTLNDQDGRTWSALGLARLQAQDPLQARVLFDRATQLVPGHIGTWHGLGWSCLLLDDTPAALRAFEQALALDGNFAESQGAVALGLLRAGRAEEAERHLALADRLDRHNVTGRYARALQQGRAGDAKAVQELALRLLDRPGLFGGRLADSLPGVKE